MLRFARNDFQSLSWGAHSRPLLAAITDTIRLVEEVVAIAERRLGVLVDRDHDRLDVRVAPAFARRPDPNVRQLSATAGYPRCDRTIGAVLTSLASVDEVFELRALAREQELRPRVVEAGLIELTRKLIQFGNPPA